MSRAAATVILLKKKLKVSKKEKCGLESELQEKKKGLTEHYFCN
jgi:hypothetical protein